MFINFKKNIWLWTAVNRVTKKLVAFFVGDRSFENFEELFENISHIYAKFYATNKFLAYNIIIPEDEHHIGKSHICTAERMNRIICRYLARFNRKTFC